MKVLVTGANGFIGTALCQRLQASGAEVVALCRDKEPAVDFSTGKVNPELLRDVNAVFHCAGIAHQHAEASQYEQVNYRAVMELAHSCLDAGVSTFIFLSSVKAGTATDPYSFWKGRAEQDLLAQFTERAMRVVIIRPALVYGVGVKGNFRTLIRAVRRGMPAPPAGGKRSLVGLPDLCEVLAMLAQQAPAGVSLFEVTDGEVYDLSRIYIAVRGALGKSVPRAWLPLPVWWLACRLLDVLPGRAAGQGNYQKLFGTAVYSNQALVAALNWQPRQRLEDMVEGMVEETVADVVADVVTDSVAGGD